MKIEQRTTNNERTRSKRRRTTNKKQGARNKERCEDPTSSQQQLKINLPILSRVVICRKRKRKRKRTRASAAIGQSSIGPSRRLRCYFFLHNTLLLHQVANFPCLGVLFTIDPCGAKWGKKEKKKKEKEKKRKFDPMGSRAVSLKK